MAHDYVPKDFEQQSTVLPQPDTRLDLFPYEPEIDVTDITALVQDFFCWFEQEWQQPVTQESPERIDPPVSPSMDSDALYSKDDLCRLWGYTLRKITDDMRRFRVHAEHDRVCNYRGLKTARVYSYQSLAEVMVYWNKQRFNQWLDSYWKRFFLDEGGTCACGGRRGPYGSFRPGTNYCAKHDEIYRYYKVFGRFLQALQSYGSIAACWQHGFWIRSDFPQTRGFLLIYLLDRRLLQLSPDELTELLPSNMRARYYLHLWRHRHPEEFSTFQRVLTEEGYPRDSIHIASYIVATFVLLRYGLRSLADLRRVLTPDEIEEAIREKRLITPYLGYGTYLPFPLAKTIQVGHVALDEIRTTIMRYGATYPKRGRPRHWGPNSYKLYFIRMIERALSAKGWHDGEPLLAKRPELDKFPHHNPYVARSASGFWNAEITDLPTVVQDTIVGYLRYRYNERRLALTTLVDDLSALVPFFIWLHLSHPNQSDYSTWNQNDIQRLMKMYLAAAGSHMSDGTKESALSRLYVFFRTLTDMGQPTATGYRAILALRPRPPYVPKHLPNEDVMDRIFSDGVSQLDYDPFSRLELTIQYFCGTRITETCDLPLLCVLEDEEGNAFLYIPKGKTKQERAFPIVDVGMGPLLQYMDEVVRMQVCSDGTLRPCVRTNYRYASVSSDKAENWLYLFDRYRTDFYRGRGRLSSTCVRRALHQALVLAAKIDPSGLFVDKTYDPHCHMRRPRGTECVFFASHDGVTVCPICQGNLPGRRGYKCTATLSEDFICDGTATNGEFFCPKCDSPLAEFVNVTSHTFRHNSVTRAHRTGMSLVDNMLLHGHSTVPMHVRYLHLSLEDARDAVRLVMVDKLVRDLRASSLFSPGQVVEDGIASTQTVEQLLGLTLRRGLKRRTSGLWGGFWTGALADMGTSSPVRSGQDIVLTEETYHHAVAQYRYEALGLAVSEVALEQGTKGKFKAHVPSFLDHEKIDQLVSGHIGVVLHQGYLGTAQGLRLVEKRELRRSVNLWSN